jgi:hypothetical protein
MARRPGGIRRKLVEFDEETWLALDLLRRDQMKSFDELAGEAFRDLLRKYGQPESLKAALMESARGGYQSAAKLPAARRKSHRSSKRGR